MTALPTGSEIGTFGFNANGMHAGLLNNGTHSFKLITLWNFLLKPRGERRLRRHPLFLWIQIAYLLYDDLRGADLRGANLKSVDLNNTNLSGANLSGLNLTETILYGANLSNSKLIKANLRQVDLKGADLSNADLREVNFFGADLRRSNVDGADLYKANLNSALLEGIENIELAKNIYTVKGFNN